MVLAWSATMLALGKALLQAPHWKTALAPAWDSAQWRSPSPTTTLQREQAMAPSTALWRMVTESTF